MYFSSFPPPSCSGTRGVRYSKSLLIQYVIDSNIFQNPLIDINIFRKFLYRYFSASWCWCRAELGAQPSRAVETQQDFHGVALLLDTQPVQNMLN